VAADAASRAGKREAHARNRPPPTRQRVGWCRLGSPTRRSRGLAITNQCPRVTLAWPPRERDDGRRGSSGDSPEPKARGVGPPAQV